MDQLDDNLKALQRNGFEEVASSVFVADLLPKNVCDAILLEFYGSHQWKPAKIAIAKKSKSGVSDIVGVIDTKEKYAYHIAFRDLDMNAKPNTAGCLTFVQDKVCAFARAEFGLNFEEFGGAEIVRYPQGGMFALHSDTHKDSSHRAFTVIIYLNDNFRGGETSFPDLQYVCKPRAGRVLVFLSTELHCGVPVIQGEKNIIVFFGFFPGSVGKEV